MNKPIVWLQYDEKPYMSMNWLNYHHLLYFWTIAHSESVAAAGVKLRLAHSTVLGQLRTLERRLGERLFVREGRRLVLTDVGRHALRYADEIFALGQELLDTTQGRPGRGPVKLIVGIADAMPKTLVHRLLQPTLHLSLEVLLCCREDRPERLLACLSNHEVDVVLADATPPSEGRVRLFSHLLGSCGVSILGTRSLCRSYQRGFPGSLNRAPMLLPTANASLRRALDSWFEGIGCAPNLRGEFEDSALLKSFGQAGLGVFPVPTIVESDVCRQYGVEVVGRVRSVQERFYAITAERRLRHPAVVALLDAARGALFPAKACKSRAG